MISQKSSLFFDQLFPFRKKSVKNRICFACFFHIWWYDLIPAALSCGHFFRKESETKRKDLNIIQNIKKRVYFLYFA